MVKEPRILAPALTITLSAQRGMTLALFLSCSAQGHALIKGYIIADDALSHR